MMMKPALTNEDALRILAASKAMAQANGWNVSIAVVDSAGDLLAFERLDGAIGPSCRIASQKARTAALWKRDTLYWENRVTEKPTYAQLPEVFAIEGGVPIVFEGQVVGGVGVSGAKADDDARMAAAGAAQVVKGAA